MKKVKKWPTTKIANTPIKRSTKNPESIPVLPKRISEPMKKVKKWLTKKVKKWPTKIAYTL
jgi:hypothetical protein